jgi:dTDP-glucose 4,6-dehydratase
MQDKPIPIYGKGVAVRDYVHTLDHASAVDLIIMKGKVGEKYCIGGDAERNTVEVAHTILDKLGKPYDLIKHTTDRPGHDPRYAMDHSKITNELGWNPQYSFEEGIEATIQWYKDNESWWRPISGEAEKIAEKYLANAI